MRVIFVCCGKAHNIHNVHTLYTVETSDDGKGKQLYVHNVVHDGTCVARWMMDRRTNVASHENSDYYYCYHCYYYCEMCCKRRKIHPDTNASPDSKIYTPHTFRLQTHTIHSCSYTHSIHSKILPISLN